MKKYILIKLIDSTTVVGKIKMNNNKEIITITDPMLYSMKISPEGTPVMSMIKYNPFSTTKDISFYYQHIICWYEPNQDLVDYYEKCLNYLNEINKEIEEKEKIYDNLKINRHLN